GKLATMTRGEATKKVSSAGGANASGVNAKLDYLVIGDEGSPLYGEGRKGSKQVKAEKLIADGAPMRIISETAFLKMLAGEPVGGDAASNEAGAARLWAMAFDPGPVDAPLARFARHYIRMHHPKICPAETDRYVDPGAEIPAEFLTFERVQPLLDDPRGAVRAVAVELARYEFGRWQPPLMALVALAESRHPEVRELVAQGFSADAHDPEWRDARIDPARLTPAAVYRFCESTRPEARELGMALIAAHPRLAVPGELFRLTESPDAGVRGFVVRQLWGLYRAKGVTQGWQPPAPKDGVAPPPVGRPAEDPAGAEDVRDFLRLTLFGIPPGRPPAAREGAGPRLKPLPARKAKLALIEVVRDLAVEDAGFAAHVRPVLHTFLGSRGASERAACLVALTRIDRAHPALAKEAA
ncbi:MAG: BRCT domain-containing protein, partial [Myxococcales bacterium]|nr:BRCT domain-containing protein [Myxococcales bacterium]